jgi:hypothetical protein
MVDKIKDLKPNTNASLEVEVIAKGKPRSFTKFGQPNFVCTFTVKDDTGEVDLSLFNRDIDIPKIHYKLKLTDIWVKEWNSQIQISLGKNGKIEKIEG